MRMRDRQPEQPCCREGDSSQNHIIAATDSSMPSQALEEAKTRDRLYIPSRYQLFTLNQVRQVCFCSMPASGAQSRQVKVWLLCGWRIAQIKSSCRASWHGSTQHGSGVDARRPDAQASLIFSNLSSATEDCRGRCTAWGRVLLTCASACLLQEGTCTEQC